MDGKRGRAEHLRTNLVAYLALFAALGGTAYAGSKIGSDDIARNAVLSKHIKAGQVKAADTAKPRLIKVKPNPLVNDDPCQPGGVTRVRTFCGLAHGGAGGPSYIKNGGGYAPTAFYKSGGTVHVTGSPEAYGYGPPSDIFILPKGYRPAGKVAFSQSCFDGNTDTWGPCLLAVYPDGRVAWEAGTFYIRNPTPGRIHLDGIEFVAR